MSGARLLGPAVVGASGLVRPRPEADRAAASSSRSAGQAARQQRIRDEALLDIIELDRMGIRMVTPGGGLTLKILQALASRDLVEPAWKLTPAGRKHAAQLRGEPAR